MGLPGNADVAELVDALDLGSSAERRGGSSPFIRTILRSDELRATSHLKISEQKGLSEALAKERPEQSIPGGASKALRPRRQFRFLPIRCT